MKITAQMYLLRVLVGNEVFLTHSQRKDVHSSVQVHDRQVIVCRCKSGSGVVHMCACVRSYLLLARGCGVIVHECVNGMSVRGMSTCV